MPTYEIFKLCKYDLSFLINFLIGLRLASLTALSEKSEEGIQSNKRQSPAAQLRGGPTTCARIAHFWVRSVCWFDCPLRNNAPRRCPPSCVYSYMQPRVKVRRPVV